MNLKDFSKKIDEIFEVDSLKRDFLIKYKNSKNIIGFYSEEGGSGVSTIMYQLALNLSPSKKCLIIDTNFVNPGLYHKLGDSKNKTLQNYFLDSSLKLQDCIIHKQVDYLNFTPFSDIEYISNDTKDNYTRLQHDLIKEVFKNYDYIFIDLFMYNFSHYLFHAIFNDISSIIRIRTHKYEEQTIFSKILKDIPIQDIYNKSIDQLPYEPEFYLISEYNKNVMTEPSISETYKERFKQILEQFK